MEINKAKLRDLFISFFKIGAFSFGGGYAMLPVIEREVVGRRKWVSWQQLQDVFAITGCLPGAIALNAAAFTGYVTRGVSGMVVAVCGNLLPSVFIVLSLCAALAMVRNNPIVEAAFLGIRPVVVGLIAYAAYNMAKSSFQDGFAIFIGFGALVVCLIFPTIGVIPVILLGAITGIVVKTIRRNKF